MTICKSCGSQSRTAHNFCTQCGSRMKPASEIKARLSVVEGEPEGALFVLRNGRTTIGHDCGNIIVLGDEHISNKHASILYENEIFKIQDRHSRNGVFVNGEKVTEATPLCDGCVIRLGDTLLKFEQLSLAN